MQHFKLLAAAMGAALLVAACGGGGNGDQSPAIKYTAVVSFGDSLSDPGAYKVGSIKDAGGGMFTVNGINGVVGSVGADLSVPSYNWAQLVSAAAIGQVSCAAREGGYGISVVFKAGCTNYAQGGSRVTLNVGPGYKGFSSGAFLGAMTESVATQVANFLASSSGNRFAGTELVTMLAGANDLFGQATILTAAATEAGGAALIGSLVTQLTAGAPSANQAAAQGAIYPATLAAAMLPAATPTSIITAAMTAAGTHAYINTYTNTAVANAATVGQTAGLAALAAGATYAGTTGADMAITGMVTAANELAASVKNMISKGATRVVVVNLPDVSKTPYALSTIKGADNSTQQLVLAMTMAFNTALQTGLAGTPGVLFVDAFSENQRQIANPSHYGLTNVTGTACNLSSEVNSLATIGQSDGSSLVCKASNPGFPGNLIAGDTSHYLFADSVHPTPYGHKLLAQYVTKAMVVAGWL
jgi:phospholipase/lecithinase/hemolysin